MTRYRTLIAILLGLAIMAIAVVSLDGVGRDLALIVGSALGAGMVGASIGRALLRAHLRTELRKLRAEVASVRAEVRGHEAVGP